MQSAIALTSLARGNVPAAICGAATSTLLGIFVTPLLVFIFLNSSGANLNFAESVGKIVVQLLLPFVAGQIARPWIGAWVDRNKAVLKHVDQSSVISSFTPHLAKPWSMAFGGRFRSSPCCCSVLSCAVLLGLVLGVVHFFTPGYLGFVREDRITALFGAAQKLGRRRAHGPGAVFRICSRGAMLLP